MRQSFQLRRLKTPMAGKNHIGVVDEHRVQKADVPYARRDLPDLLSGMRSRVPGVRPKHANRDPFDARRTRRVSAIFR